MYELKGEMNKIKPPTFDGEHKKEEDSETWLLGMRKYFQLQNYSSHRRKLMKDKEQQGEFNLKLMHILERIENKLDKEGDSRKTGSHRTPERKED